MHAVYYGGPEIGMHDRLKNRHDSNPGPSQRRGPRDAATKKPERSCAALRNRSHSRHRITKGFVSGGKDGPSDCPGATVRSSARAGSFAPAAARTARMCFRAVRGSMQPNASQAASVNPGSRSRSSSRSFTSPVLQNGLRGMRCSGRILFVLCRPVPRKARQRIVAT